MYSCSEIIVHIDTSAVLLFVCGSICELTFIFLLYTLLVLYNMCASNVLEIKGQVAVPHGY